MLRAEVDPLVEVSTIVRRVLAARTSDPHLIEDLAQETIVRVAAARERMTPEALCAYSIVVARNLLASHARGASVHGRHAHRLVEHTGIDGPEQLALEQEETAALAAALDSLDANDRALLVRHEAEGTDLATIAAETDASRGAVAMRLARARAELRLEFLLAFRRIGDVPARCRSVLLALSAGDRRRQRTLDAPAHLLSCPTCAGLARPVTERDRRIAGWLLVPIAEGVRRGWKAVRAHPAPAVAATTAVAALATIGVLQLRADDDSPPAAAGTTTTGAPPATAARDDASTTTSTASTSTSVVPPACAPAQTLDQLDPAEAVGCAFAPSVVTAIDVPVDEGFWVSTPDDPEMWVMLTGPGESPVEVAPGAVLQITGVVAAVPADPDAGGPPPEDPRADAQPFVLQVGYDQLVVMG